MNNHVSGLISAFDTLPQGPFILIPANKKWLFDMAFVFLRTETGNTEVCLEDTVAFIALILRQDLLKDVIDERCGVTRRPLPTAVYR